MATARLLVEAGLATPDEMLARYDEVGWQVRKIAEEVLGEPKLATAAEIVATAGAPPAGAGRPGRPPTPAEPAAAGRPRSAAGCPRTAAR